MKIVLFGATGRVGGYILKRALKDGHEVTVLVRSRENLPLHNKLTVVEGDVREEDIVSRAMIGANAVLSALGTDRTTTLTEAMPHMIREMEAIGVKRIVTIGTAGILQSRNDSDKLRYQAGDSNRRLTFAAEEHHKVYDMLRESELKWTIVCPTYLPDGEAIGGYRTLRNFLPEDGSKITVGDTADFAYEELIEGKHVGFRVGLAY